MTVKVMINTAEPAEMAAATYAARLARRMRTDLFVFSVMPRPETMVVYSGMDGAVAMSYGAAEAAREEQTNRRKAIDNMFAAVMTEESMTGDDAELQHYAEFPAYQAVREAVVGGPLIIPRTAGSEDQELANAFQRVLMEARLPVVLAPMEGADLGTAVIAWDGSAEASRAVRFHLDLLKAHDRVIIAQNPDDISTINTGDHTDPKALQAWLKSVQLPTEIVTFGGKIADGLRGLAEKENAGLIVSGAYGHSRIGEFFFGGATRGLLKAKTGPALALAH